MATARSARIAALFDRLPSRRGSSAWTNNNGNDRPSLAHVLAKCGGYANRGKNFIPPRPRGGNVGAPMTKCVFPELKIEKEREKIGGAIIYRDSGASKTNRATLLALY